MRIVSLNVNGLRSAAAKGFLPWMADQDADVVCLQEVRLGREPLPEALLRPAGYSSWFHAAERPGYSGVAVYSRRTPDRIRAGLGWADVDLEARYLQADFGRLSVVSLYVPSGSSGAPRQTYKFAFLDRFLPFLQQLVRDGRHYVLCGDWNIAHRPIDLRNWRSNQKNSGFLPEERAWMDRLLGEAGFVDAFRRLHPHAEQYTWWSNRGQAWAKNVGWRIDYQIVTPGLGARVRRASVYTQQRFSDHAPLVVDYGYPFRRKTSPR